MSPKLFWIPGPWTGRLAIAARPRGGDWLADEASAWRQAGLDLVVSLLETGKAAELDLANEQSVAEANGLRFVSFPVPDRGTPGSSRDALALLKGIDSELETGKNVAVHCRQGIGRSGLIAAGALVAGGMAANRAIEAVSAARGLRIPETAAQQKWIQRLPSQRLAEAV